MSNEKIKKLVLATHNKGKLRQFQELFAAYDVEIISSGELGIDSPPETEDTFAGNAFIKARYVAQKTNLPVLADDSGLCVNALGGLPGVYTADWTGENRDYPMAMARVNNEIGNNPDRSAYFYVLLALVMPNGEEKTFEGKCNGQITWPPRGNTDGTFGYEPILTIDGENRTMAEMTLDEKAKISHRGKAFAAFAKEMLQC